MPEDLLFADIGYGLAQINRERTIEVCAMMIPGASTLTAMRRCALRHPLLAVLISTLAMVVVPAGGVSSEQTPQAQEAPGQPPAASPSKQPPSIETRIAAVRELLDKDDYEAALAESRRIVEEKAEDGRAHAFLGDALYRRGDFEEAEAAYRRSIALDDGCAAGHFGVGRILRTLGRYGEAAAFFHRAATLEPDKPLYVRILANHLARRPDSIAMLERYLELAGPEEERIRKNVSAWIALLEHLGDEPLSQTVRAEPTDLAMNVLRGQAYIKADLNRVKGARFAFDTGATGMTISPRLAKNAKVEVIRPFEIVGMGGKGTVGGDLVLIRELSLGGISLRNVAASIAEPQGPEEGLIGPSLFSSFHIRIDLRKGTLSLRPRSGGSDGEGSEPDRARGAESVMPGSPPDRAGAVRDQGGTPAPGTGTSPSQAPPGPAGSPAGQGRISLSFRNVGGQIVVPAQLNGVTLNAMVDTGASSSLSSFSAAPRVPGIEVLPAALSSGRSFGLAGAMDRKTIRSATLGFGGKEFQASGLPSVDLSHFSRALESEVYLVIGFPELESFALEIDYQTNSLRLDPADR